MTRIVFKILFQQNKRKIKKNGVAKKVLIA
jgi:hypothetical protein